MSSSTPIFEGSLGSGKPLKKGGRRESWQSHVKGLNTRAKNRKNRRKKRNNR